MGAADEQLSMRSGLKWSAVSNYSFVLLALSLSIPRVSYSTCSLIVVGVMLVLERMKRPSNLSSKSDREPLKLIQPQSIWASLLN